MVSAFFIKKAGKDMDKERLIKMAKDSRYISGIYNYCDRWCERCSFTSRCLNYSMSEEEFNDPESRDITNKAFWDKLHSIFQITKELVMEKAKELGIDLNASDIESAQEENQRKEETVKEHALSKSAHKYIKMVKKCFEDEFEQFKDKEEELNTLINIGVDEEGIKEKADSISDAVEIIQWYQHQIYVKLKRALSKDYIEDEVDEILKMDSDGSAKVVLISIDRSIGAWGILQTHFQAQTDGILDILLHLDRLRRDTEKDFPDARNFKRPGFDDYQTVLIKPNPA